MQTDDDRPHWDEDDARKLLRRQIIVGVTVLSADDELIEQKQLHGEIVIVDERRGIAIRQEPGGALYWLPPHLSAIQPAPPGTYRLRSTGEEVVDPDLLTTWTVRRPPAD